MTTPIFYVNGAPHIGHAYTSVMTDVVARWHRMEGHSTLFLTGTDEHGLKVQEAAQMLKISPQALCDSQAEGFRDLFSSLNVSFDRFIRTTESVHQASVHAVWNQLCDDGLIYLGKHEGWYSVSDEAYYTETQVQEVVVNEQHHMVAIETGSVVKWVDEENYMFRLSVFEAPLLSWLRSNPEAIWPASRHEEVLRFVERGLRDLSVSRRADVVKWGIEVPGDSSHVVYVWLDALTNYITAAGYPDHGMNSRGWPPKYQVVGKDILRFHAVYWPAFLMALGLPLPQHIVAHGWWTRGGKKMSKSIGNVVDPVHLIAETGCDQLRFFLCREGGNLGGDIDFDEDRLNIRVNSELANDLGNLVRRVLTPALYREPGVVPACGALSEEDQMLCDAISKLGGEMGPQIKRFQVQQALETLWQVVRATNRYLDHTAPWSLRKGSMEDAARAETVMYVALEALRVIGVALHPFTPQTSDVLLTTLGIPAERRSASNIKFGDLQAGHTVNLAPLILFPKREKRNVEQSKTKKNRQKTTV